MQKLCQAHAYLAESLYSDLHSVKAVGTVHELCNSADTVKYADGCEWRRVSGYVCTAYYIICSAQHVISILCIGIYVLSCIVLAHEGVYCFAERFEHCFSFLGRMCKNNALGSAERHSCCSILMAHAARQSEYVEESSFFALIRPKSASADCRTEVCIVKSDDRSKACFFVVEVCNLLMPIGTDHLDVSHMYFLSCFKMLFLFDI